MLIELPKHKFEMKAHFERMVMFTFTVPKEELKSLIPACFELDVLDDKWGMITLAFVKAKGLKPVFLPEFMGNDLIISGYRIFVKYTDKREKRLRGIYIIKSETDSFKIGTFGNVFTNYNFSRSKMELNEFGEKGEVKSNNTGIEIKYDLGHDALPEGSPFNDFKIARRYVGPLPYTFSYDDKKKEVIIVKGERSNWKPLPVKVTSMKIPFLDQFNFSEIKLANAFELKDIPYKWEKGRKEKLND